MFVESDFGVALMEVGMGEVEDNCGGGDGGVLGCVGRCDVGL